MKTKPFDLLAAINGAKLVTRDGRDARFIAHVPEVKDGFRVVAMIEGNPRIIVHREDGRASGSIPFREDLFIKPATIKIGDMEVPEPCREPLEMGQKYWLVAFEKDYIFDFGWEGDGSDFDWLKAARIHLTLEAAEQHRIALIKVSGGEP